jgi:hypothetical protein
MQMTQQKAEASKQVGLTVLEQRTTNSRQRGNIDLYVCGYKQNPANSLDTKQRLSINVKQKIGVQYIDWVPALSVDQELLLLQRIVLLIGYLLEKAKHQFVPAKQARSENVLLLVKLNCWMGGPLKLTALEKAGQGDEERLYFLDQK